MTSDQADKFKALVDKVFKPPHGALATSLYSTISSRRYIQYTAQPAEAKQLLESDFKR